MQGPSVTTLGLVLLAMLVLEVIGQNQLCPAGAKFYVTQELCYWTDNEVVVQTVGQSRCVAQGGGLALIPDPWAGQFLLNNFALNTYTVVPIILTSHYYWIGYKSGLLAGEVTTMTGEAPPWHPSMPNLLGLSTCVAAGREGSNPQTLNWQAELATTSRRSLCSKFSGLPTTRQKHWRGEKGRLVSSVLKTLRARSRIQCASVCHLRDGCASFNFNKRSGACELCGKFKVAGLTFDPSAADFKHYELSYRA